MKKLPVLYKRQFNRYGSKIVDKHPIKGMEWVKEEFGIPMLQLDGFCCAIIEGNLYKRCIFKGSLVDWGKNPCSSLDILCLNKQIIDWRYRYWVLAERDRLPEKHLWKAYDKLRDLSGGCLKDGTYEFVGAGTASLANASGQALFGSEVQDNPYGLKSHALVRHDMLRIDDLPHRDFDSIRDYLEKHYIKGIVFWLNGEPKCKIRRKDFGFSWGNSELKREARMAVLNCISRGH